MAEGRLTRVSTAWHCCLEFYSIASRLPSEYRLPPVDAETLLREEVLARAAGAEVVVTDNRRHFLAALRHGIRVETTDEFAATLKRKR